MTREPETVASERFSDGTFARAAGLLFFAALVVYFPLLVPGQAPYSPFSDIVALHVGLKDVLHRGLQDGVLPLWRVDQMFGAPALTQPQTLYTHPLHFAFWFTEPARAFGPTFFFSFYVGALGAYAFARRLGVSFAAALLAGLAQLVSFKLIAVGFAGWASALATLVMLPWIGRAVVDCALAPGLCALVVASLTFAVTFAGGSPQVPYYALLVFSAFPLVIAGAESAQSASGGDAGGKRIGQVLRAYGALLSSIVLGVACNAYLWLPVVSDLPLMVRAQQGYTYFLSGHGLRLADLSTWLTPEIFGTPLDQSYARVELWEDVAYFGIVPLAFGLYVLLRLRTAKPAARYLAAAFLLSALVSLESPLLRGLYDLLPGYALFRLPARMLFVTSVVGILLFAFGLDALLVQLRARSVRVAQGLVVVLALVLVGEGAYYAQRYLTTVDANVLLADRDHPARDLGRAENQRVVALGPPALSYGWASGLGIELVNGYDASLFAHVRDYLALVTRGRVEPRVSTAWLDLPALRRLDLLQAMSVGYALFEKPRKEPWLRPITHADAVRNFRIYRGMLSTPLYVYALPEPAPRVRFASRTVQLPSIAAVEQWLEKSLLGGEGLVLESAPGADLGAPGPSDTVEVLSRKAGALRLRTTTEKPRLLLLAEAFHPGWQASIDGITPAPVHRANLAMLGVFVPRGTHELELHFWPTGFTAGLIVSALAVALLLAAALLSAARTPKR